MNNSAHHPLNILITDIGSYLGSNLAKSLLSQQHAVYGAGKTHPNEQILANHKFTLIDINLSQPFPAHLPNFDLIIHLSSENLNSQEHFSASRLSASSANILDKAREGKSRVIFASRITTSPDLLETMILEGEAKKHFKLLLVGDVYGPDAKLHFQHHRTVVPSYFENNNLTNLLSQAVETDKIILEKEGLTMIYPTHIEDAVSAFNKFIFDHSSKSTRFVVSSSPLTSLSAAYEIQNSARLYLGKELNLFFAGPESFEKPQPEPVVRISDLGFSPEHNFKDGIKETLEYFKDSNQVKVLHPSRPPKTLVYRGIPDKNDQPQLTTHQSRKLPKISINNKFKVASVFFLAALIVLVGKMSAEIFLGASSLKTSQKQLLSGNFQKASTSAKNAQGSFSIALTEFSLITAPLAPVIPVKIRGLRDSLESAKVASMALANFILGAESLEANLQIITRDKPLKATPDTETPQAFLNNAYFQSSRAVTLAQKAQKAGIFKGKLEALTSNLKSLSDLSLTALQFSSLTNDVISPDGKKTYLILLQNNSELRPGGGFIGNFGEISFIGGKLKDIDVQDIYTIDGQLKEKIEPPKVLTEKLGVKQLYLRDSNWSTDFDLNAKTVRDFYKKETGKTVDGVVAIDLTYVQKILEKIGPIKLDDYNEQINAQNLFDKGEYYAEVGFFPGSTQKRDFFASLTRKLISKIVEGISSQDSTANGRLPALGLITTSADALAEKHILLSLDNPNLSAFIKSKNWSNQTPPYNFDPTDDSQATRDFLALSEANVGANKANRYLERQIDYEVTIGRDADLMAKLTLTYKNNSPADTWPAGAYVNYLRVAVPLGSGLESLDDGQKDHLAGKKNPKNADENKVQVLTQGNLTVFETLVEIPTKTSRTLTFTYRIPKNIKLEKAPVYSLYTQKQPGTEKDPFKFTFNLPGYLKIDAINDNTHFQGKQNVSAQTDLSIDRQFQVKVSKR